MKLLTKKHKTQKQKSPNTNANSTCQQQHILAINYVHYFLTKIVYTYKNKQVKNAK